MAVSICLFDGGGERRVATHRDGDRRYVAVEGIGAGVRQRARAHGAPPFGMATLPDGPRATEPDRHSAHAPETFVAALSATGRALVRSRR